MSNALRTGPLSHCETITPGETGSLSMASVDDRGMIDLRLDASDLEARAAAEKALGFVLPTEPRSARQSRGRYALWWSPDQWIITCARSQAGILTDKLRDALSNCHAMVTDVSDARAIIQLSGRGARETIMKGSSANLLESDVGAGHIRRTQIAETAVAIHVISLEPEVLNIFVFRSYADYLWHWLTVAGRKGAAVNAFTRQTPPPV